MRPRDLALLFGTLCLGAMAGIALLGEPTLAVEWLDPAHLDAADDDSGSAGRGRDAAVPVDAPFTDSLGPVAAVSGTARPSERRVDTTGWTSGVVRGDIRLAVSALPRLQTMTIVVEEARSAIREDNRFERPHRLLVPVTLGLGTPTFEVTGVPFSDYPYIVSVHAPGLNGSRRTITLDRDRPLVDDIVLEITRGAPFSLLVRDQDAAPYPGLEAKLLPVGEPAGRPRHAGTTDNFGSVVFEEVLAGDYQLLVALAGQPVLEAQTVTVQPGVPAAHNSVQGQSRTVTVPRGVPLRLHLHDAAGYGVAGASVRAIAADRIKLTEVPATSDHGGFVDFPHLQPGVWHVIVELENFQRADLQITLQPDQAQQFREVRLVRTR